MATAISYRNHDQEPPVSPIQTEFSSPTTQRIGRNDGEHGNMSPVSPIMSRRASYESDRYSTASGLASQLPNHPTNVNPPPAYVAAHGASQVVSEHQASQQPLSSDSEEESQKRKEDIQFSQQALSLINAFLDQLLYSFLSASQSTSLLALRPAVTEVLKHRLAKEAISSADSELAELLAGGDEEEDIDTKHRSQEGKRQWDLELVWKRTRLRVMVYIRLGEMEDEDEQRYVQEEELFYASERRFTSSTGLVSWSAAIFLTHVLEYVAEQTLRVAGQAAHTRARRQSRTHRRSMSSDVMFQGDFMVEEYDVEKVALNPMLGRLWRTWRKALRNNAIAGTPVSPSSPARSRTSGENTMAGAGTRGSFSTAREGESRPMSRDEQDNIPEMEHPEYILAANIPLPMWNPIRDIDEIMIEGLARDLEDEVDAVDFFDCPYPELMLAELVALPPIEEKQDIDEIEVPGLARDPDAVEEDQSWLLVSKAAIRRKSFSDYSAIRALPATLDVAPSSLDPINTSVVTRSRATSLPPSSSLPMFVEDEFADLPPPEEHNAAQDKEQEPAVDGIVEGEHAETHQDANGRPATESLGQESKGEFPWMAAGAVAGASAAVATAAALATSAMTDTPSAANQPADVAANVNNEDGKTPSAVPGSWLEIDQDPQAQPLSEKEVEELDKRKSLLNIKDMMVVNGPSAEDSGEQSPQADTRSASNYSVDDGSDEKEVVVSGEDGLRNDKDDLGVARGVVLIGSPESPSAGADLQQARDLGQRPADLVIGAVPLDGEATQELTPRTPRQFLDLTSENELPADAPPLPVNAASDDLSHPNGVATTSTSHAENGSPARSASASLHEKRSSESGVQEHPMVQRLASLKGSEASSASGSEKAVPMTSAAIRGPEDFDMLVQNGETLKYTLTPEHVRDEPGDNQIRYVEKSSPVEMDATSSTAPFSAPSDDRVGRAATSEGKTSTADKRRSQSRPSATNTTVTGKSGFMAREPRVLTESTRDFADFIRSTGPNKDAAVSPLMRNASSSSLHSLRSAHIRGASASRSASRSSSPGADPSRVLQGENDVPPVPPVPTISRRARNGMEARGAKINDNGSSDLIDFIRAGPKQNGEHRISRNVAPFRTTMDSDRFDDPSVRTTPSLNTVSHRTSANSRSALLSPSNGLGQAAQPLSNGASGGADSLSAPGASNGSRLASETTKKQYRNKDPYALDFDFDDADDDFELSTPKGGQKNESFLEFLRSQEPVASEPVRPLIDPNSAQARRIINNARQGNIATDGRARAMPSSAGSRNGSLSGSRQAQISSTVSAPKPKLEARSPGSKSRAANTSRETNDLAQFIRSSGPPDDADTAPAPEVGRGSKLSEKERKKAEKQKRGSFFSRGKPQRYLDMP